MQTVDTATSTPSMSPDLDVAMSDVETLYTLCAQAQGMMRGEGRRPSSPTSTDLEVKLESLRSAMQNNIGSGARNISLVQMNRLLELLGKMIDVVPIGLLQNSHSIDLILAMGEMITQCGRHTEVAPRIAALQSRRKQRLTLGRGV